MKGIALSAAVTGAIVVAVVGVTPGSAGSIPSVARSASSTRAHQVIDELLAQGVIKDASEVIAVSPDAIALHGDPTGPSVSSDALKASSTSTKGGGATKGGKSGGSGGTVTLGGGSGGSGGSSTSYSLTYGSGLLTSYVLSSVAGTPTSFIDGLTASAADATTYTGSAMVWASASTGTEPLNGEVRISSSSTQICGSDQAVGCTTTWYDGSRVLKAEIRIRSFVDPTVARCVIGHEMGHALGLGHVNDSTQLMNPIWTAGVSPCRYQAGDAHGLTVMGSVKSTL